MRAGSSGAPVQRRRLAAAFQAEQSEAGNACPKGRRQEVGAFFEGTWMCLRKTPQAGADFADRKSAKRGKGVASLLLRASCTPPFGPAPLFKCVPDAFVVRFLWPNREMNSRPKGVKAFQRKRSAADPAVANRRAARGAYPEPIGKRGWTRSGPVPAPVPRLVGDAVRVVARVGEAKAEASGVLAQPLECTGLLEALLQRR